MFYMPTIARTLYGVRHKAKHEYNADVRDFYKLFFLCDETVCDVQPQPGLETMDAAFFPVSALPQLSTGRVLEKDILSAFEVDERGHHAAFFD